MQSPGNETLDRIQREIEEALERENELRQKYNLLNNNEPEAPKSLSPTPPVTPTNGFTPDLPQNGRKFAPNPNKGVMQKFLKMRGKLSLVGMKPQIEPQNAWIPDATFEPPKVTIGSGKLVRNGFIPAEEKMKRELAEFQKREEELRMERKKSQPDLMAALEREQVETNLRSGMHSNEDLTENRNGGSNLRRAKSLAELLDASDDELEHRGTYSLIKQFENLSHS